MPDLGRPDFESEPTVDAIHRADTFIDSLAVGRPVLPQDAADAELAALLGNWRDEMRWPPATDLITEADAVAALNAGRAERRLGPGRDRWIVDTEITPRKSRRGLSVVGAAAAAALCIGGFGAVVAGAGPGDSLYGVRTMLFGTPKEVRDDQVGLAAKTTLNQVQDLISQGDWTQAQDKLVEVSTQVASIGDEQQKQDLLDQFNNLSAKVVERDPAATAPPGVVYTVAPSAAELAPVLAPSTSGAPSAGDSTTSTTSTTSESSSSSVTSTSSATTSSTQATSSGAASSTTSVSESASPSASPSAASESSAASSAASSAPASSGSASPAATTTPTSAAPSTAASAAQATTPASAAPTTAVPSVSTTAEAPAESAKSAQTAVETVQPAQSAPVTTTALIPVPAG